MPTMTIRTSFHKPLFLLIYLFTFCCFCLGQTARITSIKKAIANAKDANEKLSAVFSLCEETESLNVDTLQQYALLAKQLAAAQKNSSNILVADYYLANSFYQKALVDSAEKIIADNETVFTKTPHPSAYIKFNLLKGRCLMRKKDYKQALSIYYGLLSETEQAKDSLNEAICLGAIGSVKDRMGDKRDALNQFLQAIKFSVNPQYRKKTAYLFTNAAVMYNMLDRTDSSESYIRTSLQYARTNENLTDLANGLGFYAGYLMDNKKYPEAEASLKEAIEVRKKIGNLPDIVTDMGVLAMYYYNVNQPKKGIDVSLKAIDMAKEHLAAKLPFLYDALAWNYSKAKDYKRYSETLEKIVALKDSLYQNNSAEAMADLQTKYEVQKKENTIIHQQFDLVKKDYFIYSSILLFLLASLSAWLVFKAYKKRQKQKATKAVAEAEETERKRIAADLHDNLGAYAASIASNLNRISSMEKDTIDISALQELHNNSNAIVAELSDTIWALKKEALPLTAVSDRIKVFIHRIESSYPSVSIDVQENVETDHLLTPSQGFHLFQTLQESINNALKHSGCSRVTVSIKGHPNQWEVKISDNGRGMTAASANSGGGNGLFNMKNRAKEAGWEIEWLPNEPHGTSVIIHPTV